MNNIKKILLALTVAEAVFAICLFNIMDIYPFGIRLAILAVFFVIAIIADLLILGSTSASAVSDAKKLKDADDYIRAFQAWLNEDTPFAEYIRLAVNQLESLKRKQKALRAILDDSKDSPFLTTANEVDQYVLANCKRILNRVMIYDKNDAHKLNMHVVYLQEVLGENAHVLSDFENLILEVSQIGDNATAASTPCLTELTNALRSVRSGSTEDWDQQYGSSEPPQQTMMQ